MVFFGQRFRSLLRNISPWRKPVALSRCPTEESVDNNHVSNSHRQQHSPLPSPKSQKITETCLESGKILLKVLDSVADYVPFVGLAAVVNATLGLIEQYEKLKQNDVDIEGLHSRIRDLRGFIETVKDTSHIPDSLIESLGKLGIEEIVDDINTTTETFKPSWWTKYLFANGNSKVIAELAGKINNLFDDINNLLRCAIMEVTADSNQQINTVIAPLVTNHRRQGVQDKLIKAPNALPDSFGRKACLPGTRRHILRRITRWITEGEETQQIFCLTGESGSGKTAIAVSISSERGSELKANNTRVAGFFCSSTFDDASNSTFIFPTLAGQLAQSDGAIYTVLEPLLGQQDPTHGSGKTQFKNLLIDPLENVTGKTLLVIDGLDECKDLKATLEVVETLLMNISKIPSLKVLFCCRSNTPIVEKIRSANPHYLSLDDVELPQLRHDLCLVLKSQLETVKDFTPRNISSLFDVINNSSCSFFVALAACEELSLSNPPDQVNTFKNLLSRGMNSIYESLMKRAFSNVDPVHQDLSNEPPERPYFAALVIVAFGKNSLELPGISELLGIPIDQLQAFLSGFPDYILSIDRKMVFIRLSAFQEYLESAGRVQSTESSLFDSIHVYITQRLFCYMNRSLHRHISGANGSCRRASGPLKHKSTITPTSTYACRYWHAHLTRIDASETCEGLQPLFCQLRAFFQKHLLHWLEVLIAIGDRELIPEKLTQLLDWILKAPCHPTADTLSSLESIIRDAHTSFSLVERALESSPHQVYHSFLLPWTPSSKRLADLYRHVETSITVTEVSCHRRQLLAMNSDGNNIEEPLTIKFSYDAHHVVVVKKHCILVGESDGDTSTNELKIFLEETESQTYIDASFVGRNLLLVTTLSSLGYAEVHLWNVVSKTIERPLLQQYQANTSKLLPVVVFLPTKRKSPSMVALLTSSRVIVWDVQTWKEQLSIQCREDQPRLLALSPHHILIGLRLRGFPDRTHAAHIDFAGAPCCASFSPDGSTLAVAGHTDISLYRKILGNKSSTIYPTSNFSTTYPITSLVLSPKGSYLVAMGNSNLWAWKTWKGDLVQPFIRLKNKEKQTVSSVVFSGNGRYLHCAHVCPGSETALFDMRLMEEPISVQMPVTALAMSCNGKIATGSSNGAVAIWNSNMTSVLRYWKRERHRGPVMSIVFSPDGRFIASVSPERVYIRATDSDLGSDEVAQRIMQSQESLLDVKRQYLSPCAFSGDASLFVCAVETEPRSTFAQIWKLAARKLKFLGEFKLALGEVSIQSISLSQTGTLLAISDNENTLAVYTLTYNDTSIHAELNTLRKCVLERPVQLRLRFTTDDKYVLTSAGAFDVKKKLELDESVPLADAYLQDGWVVDSEGQQRCWLPFGEDICDWASHGSMLTVCTRTLGNVILIAVRSLQ
ncbi:hypothetical protein F5880DRAFT_149403 [Lentinula raphanica]|nr:hypothetical protein F5880DRAFT_149403 [Lentinula raphanica]